MGFEQQIPSEELPSRMLFAGFALALDGGTIHLMQQTKLTANSVLCWLLLCDAHRRA